MDEHRAQLVAAAEAMCVWVRAQRATWTEESGIARRPLIRNTLLGALGLVGITPILALRDLGPLPGDSLLSTPWKAGMRVFVDVLGTPIKPSDLEFGTLVNGQPAMLKQLTLLALSAGLLYPAEFPLLSLIPDAAFTTTT